MDELKRRFRISHRIAEEWCGVISEADRSSLEQWRSESPRHEEEYQRLSWELREWSGNSAAGTFDVESAWEEFTRRQAMREKRNVRFLWWRWMSYAALLFLLLGSAFLLWVLDKPDKGEPVLVQQAPVEQIELAQEEVILVLADGRKVAISDTVQTPIEKEAAKFKIEDRTISYVEEEQSDTLVEYNTLIVPKGGEYKIVLMDGTQIWLNAETEFTYPVACSAATREVFLKGEAYFEVAKDANRPFVVNLADGVQIKVMGTDFNVSSYGDENEMTTTLLNGKVAVSHGGEQEQLVPNEQVVFHKELQTFSRSKVNAKDFAAWKDGKFVFEEYSLERIMRQLQRWYQMEVIYLSESVKNIKFSGDLEKYESFKKIVEMLKEVSGLQIAIKDKCVYVGAK